MVIFFLSLYLKDHLHFDLHRVGISLAFYGSGSLLGVFTGGWLVDKVGYYRVILTSLLVGGVMFILVSFLQHFALMCAGLFLLSAFGEAYRPANMTAIAFFSTPENYTRATSLNRLAINLGFSIGPLVGGILAMWHYQLIFWADGFTCLLAASVIYFFLRKPASHSLESSVNPPTLAAAPSVYTDKVFLLFLPLTAIYATCFLQFFITMPMYYKTVEALSERQIGMVMALNGILVATIEMVMIYKVQNRWKMYTFIAAGSALMAASYGALLFIHGFAWMLVLITAISFSEMIAMPFMNTLMNVRAPASRRGQYSSLYAMAWSSAQIFTPILVTQVISWSGYNLLWAVMAGLSAAVALGILRLGKLAVRLA